MTSYRAGRLTIFMGYAAGVGKTYMMLEEAHRLKDGGCDIVIGYFEPHGRKDTIALTEGLEMIPRRTVEYRGAKFEDMDTDAILARRPEVAAVDEFAHTNVPGSEREKRWQDVHVLLDAGINVVTTVNVQHLESLNDQIWQMTGIRVRETIPDWVVDEADESIFVDLTPRALRNRLERGVVYAPEKARQAMENFFTEANLNALREIAMRHTAHEVEERLQDASPEGHSGADAQQPGLRSERVLICLTGSPTSAALIRRGKRVADYLRADCLALHVLPNSISERSLDRRRGQIDEILGFAASLHIQTSTIESDNVASAIVDFARAQRITQIFMGRSRPLPLWDRLRRTVVQEVARAVHDKQITIVGRRSRA